MTKPFKKICAAGLFIIISFFILTASAQPENPFGQTFQINTRLKGYVGKPSWVLIIRDEDTGQVLPYVFDFTTNENFWVGFTFSHSYRIISSRIQFGPPPCKIDNFCHLEDGIINGDSLVITLTGDLTPNRYTNTCHVLRFKNYPFPIAETADNSSDSNSADTGDAISQTADSGADAGLNALANNLPPGASTIIESVTKNAAPVISSILKK